MQKNILKLGITLLFAFPSLCSAAPTKDLKKYVEFAERWTSFQYHGEPLPKIRVERPGMIEIIAYGEDEVVNAESKGIKLPTVNAVYSPDDKTFYVSSDVNIDDPKMEPTLAHEMVHFLQDVNGFTKSLPKKYVICTENDAYDVEMLYKKFNDIEVETIPLVYQQSLLAATRCIGSKSFAFPKWEESKLN